MRRRTVATGIVLSGTLLLGCQKAVFPKDQPRTQFEMHERMRGDVAPLQQTDVFGKPQPNLRGRLTDQE